MEVVDIMPNGKYDNLQETLEEDVEDADRVFEEDTLIPNEDIEIEINACCNEDEEENDAFAYTSHYQDCDIVVIWNIDDLSP
jgi:hypothetical protein